MDEHRHEHPQNERRDGSEHWLETTETDKRLSTAVGVFLVAAIFFFMMLAVTAPQQKETQVGQNVERNLTPDTPRNPDNVIKR